MLRRKHGETDPKIEKRRSAPPGQLPEARAKRGVRTQVFILPKRGEGLVVFTNGNHGELLIREVVETAMMDGRRLMDQVGKDTWLYLQRVPAAQHEMALKAIARSPSFVSKLMYAVDATLVEGAGLPVGERQEGRRRIDAFALGMVNGEIDPEAVVRTLELLIERDAGGPRLVTAFSAGEARAWIAALKTAQKPRTRE